MRVLRMAGTVALWIVNILAAAAFVAIGLAKFGSPEWAIKFERWGYPDGFDMVIGALEIAGGVLLLVPKLSSYAAALLGVILIGAAATPRAPGRTICRVGSARVARRDASSAWRAAAARGVRPFVRSR